MKILMLTSSFPRYEGDYCGPWILEYCRELVRQGHHVTVIAPAVPNVATNVLSSESLSVIRFSYWPIESHQKLAHPPGIIPQIKSNKFRYALVPSFLYCFYRCTKNALDGDKFDVIHSQWAIPAGYIGHILSKNYELPHVITSQGAEFFLPHKHIFSLFTRSALKNCNALLPVSAQMKERSVEYGSDPARTIVVPNAVNTDIFTPSRDSNFRHKHGIKDSTHIILTVRRLVPEKRVQDVILAIKELPQEYDICLVIGGDGPEYHSLNKMAEELDLKDRIKFIGFVDNSDLPSVYAASDSYVLSSEQEGLSLSMLEAMSSGLVVVSTECTGGIEAITQSVDGFLYSVGDYTGLSKILINIVKLSDDEKSSIGDNARAKVLKKYSVVSMVHNWVRIYKDVIGRVNPSLNSERKIQSSPDYS